MLPPTCAWAHLRKVRGPPAVENHCDLLYTMYHVHDSEIINIIVVCLNGYFFAYVRRSVHERYGAVGEQHQPDTEKQGGGKGCGRVCPGRRIRSVPGVTPVRFVPVATAPTRHVAGRGRGRSVCRGRGCVVVRWTTVAPWVGRRVQQDLAAAADDQRPSALRRHVQRSHAQAHR